MWVMRIIIFSGIFLSGCNSKQIKKFLSPPWRPAPPTCSIIKTKTPIQIDGKFEDTWKQADTLVFVNWDSSECVEKTTASLLYDDKYLYVRFVCSESVMELLGAKPEIPYHDDVVEIFLDTNRDPMNYHLIQVFPKGKIKHLIWAWSNESFDWNPDVKAAVFVNTAKGTWDVEVAVPLESLDIDPRQAYWKLNLTRTRSTKNRTPFQDSAWSPTFNRSNAHIPKYFGFVNGLNLKQMELSMTCPKMKQPVTTEEWKRTTSFDLAGIIDNSTAIEKTFASICHDGKNLYIRTVCFDSEIEKIKAKNNKHDNSKIWKDDLIEIFLSPGDDFNNYYQIVVNPLGAVSDLSWKNKISDLKWESGCIVKTKIDKDKKCWITIVTIPLKNLTVDISRWRFNLTRTRQIRNRRRPIEDTAWAPTFQKFSQVPERFGLLRLQE